MDETQQKLEAVLAELTELIPRLPDPKSMTNAQKEQEKKQHRDRLKALNAGSTRSLNEMRRTLSPP